MDLRDMTTTEADAYRAGLAAGQDRVNLTLTILRAELERGGQRDTAAVRRAYRVLGGIGAEGSAPGRFSDVSGLVGAVPA